MMITQYSLYAPTAIVFWAVIILKLLNVVYLVSPRTKRKDLKVVPQCPEPIEDGSFNIYVKCQERMTKVPVTDTTKVSEVKQYHLHILQLNVTLIFWKFKCLIDQITF